MVSIEYCCFAADSKKALSMAGKLGFDSVCFLDGGTAGARGNVKTVNGLLVEENGISAMRKKVMSSRKSYAIIAVRTGSDEMNRAALDIPEIDILLPGPGTKIDVVMAKTAAKNAIHVAFELTGLVQSSGTGRSRTFSQMRRNALHVRKFGAPFIITSGALSEWDLRSPSELASFGKLLGFDEKAARESFSDTFLKECRKRSSKGWVMPGVEVVG